MNPKSKPQVKKVVLAYSGGLDTSVIVPWLKETMTVKWSAFVQTWGRATKTCADSSRKPSTAARVSASSMT
jgi:argininosuccinate synthase